MIDYNEEFRLFLSTRNPNPFIPPDAASIVTEVNFTTTGSGLRGQVGIQNKTGVCIAEIHSYISCWKKPCSAVCISGLGDVFQHTNINGKIDPEIKFKF